VSPKPSRRRKRRFLRADTVLAEEGGEEAYLWALPGCCREAFRDAVQEASGEERSEGSDCECGRSWRVVSSLDELVLERFAVSESRDSAA
jgi:hypothetical protein